MRNERYKRAVMLAALNAVAIGFYFFIAVWFDYLANLEHSMFSTSDASEYGHVSDWIFGLRDSSSRPADRPFLYPLMLGVKNFAGIPGIWFMHFVFWLFTVNMTALAVWLLTRRVIFSVLAFIFIASNTSFISLTFHALTETTALFLTSLWIVHVARSELPRVKHSDIIGLAGLMSLLVALKPVYMVPLLLLLLVVIPLAWAQHLRRGKVIALMLLALSPVATQLWFRIASQDAYTLSDNPRSTFLGYYVARVYQTVEQLPEREDARAVTGRYNVSQAVGYLLQHPATALKIFVYNTIGNIRTMSIFIDAEKHPRLFSFNFKTNRFYSYLHVIFGIGMACLIWIRDGDFRFKCCLLYCFSLFILFTASVSFYQGDRLVIIALPLWLTAYLYAASELGTVVRSTALAPVRKVHDWYWNSVKLSRNR